MRKPICICENKDADQLCSNRKADQRLCFRYVDSTIPLLSKSKISSLKPNSSVAVQPGLCRTWSETPKTGFLRTRLILSLEWSLPSGGVVTSSISNVNNVMYCLGAVDFKKRKAFLGNLNFAC